MVCHGEYLVSGALALLAGVCSAAPASSVVLVGGSPWSMGSGTRTATIRLNSDGYVYHGDNAVYTSQYQWLQTGLNSDFEAYCTATGSISGTTGAWLALSSTRDWSVVDTLADGEEQSAILDISIRRVSDSVTVASATFYLTASRL